MTKPEAYPYLRIAKQFNVDYGVVLTVVDFLTHGARPTNLEAACSAMPFEAVEEISRARVEFRAIQRGEIDWQTGAKL